MNLRNKVFLPADILPQGSPPSGDDVSDVLVTGGTGYLGKYLIGDLLKHTSARLHCLVRARSTADAWQRLAGNLRTIGIDADKQPGVFERVTVVVGDASQRQLGMDDATYEQLSRQVGAIYHSAASVSFAPDYNAIEAANVLGTQHVLQFACRHQAKLVNHVSTYAVFNGRDYRDQTITAQRDLTSGPARVLETPLVGDGEGLARGYGQSKWVAEGLCEAARERGLPVNLYRAGIVSGESTSGRCNPSDTMSLTMLAVLRLGAAMTTDFLLHLTPVDFCSRAIVELSRRMNGVGTQGVGATYHLVNPQPVAWQDWVRWLQDQGHSIERVPPFEWYQRLKQSCSRYPALMPLVLLLHHDPNKDFWNDANIFQMQFDDAHVVRDLAGTGVRCPPVDARLLKTYWDFLLRAGDSYFDSKWARRATEGPDRIALPKNTLLAPEVRA